MRAVLVATTCLLIAVPGPAIAAEREELTLKNPWLAASLGPAAAVALVPVYWPVAPLALGAGHVYAGDPVRGALVGLGGAGLLAADLLGMVALYRASGRAPHESFDLTAWIGFGVVNTLAYWSWAAWDAYQVAEKHTMRPPTKTGGP